MGYGVGKLCKESGARGTSRDTYTTSLFPWVRAINVDIVLSVWFNSLIAEPRGG